MVEDLSDDAGAATDVLAEFIDVPIEPVETVSLDTGPAVDVNKPKPALCPAFTLIPTDLQSPVGVSTLVLPHALELGVDVCSRYTVRAPDGTLSPGAPVSGPCPPTFSYPWGLLALPGGAVLGLVDRGSWFWTDAKGDAQWNRPIFPYAVDMRLYALYDLGKLVVDESIFDGSVGFGRLFLANSECKYWYATKGEGAAPWDNVMSMPADGELLPAVLSVPVELDPTPGVQPLKFPKPEKPTWEGGYDLHADLLCPFDVWAIAGLDATHVALLVRTDRKEITRRLLRMTLVAPQDDSPPPEPFLKVPLPSLSSVVDVTRGHDGKLYVLVLISDAKGPRGHALQVTEDGAVVSQSAEVRHSVARVAAAANGDLYISAHYGPIYWLPNDGSKKVVGLSNTDYPRSIGRFDVVP